MATILPTIEEHLRHRRPYDSVLSCQVQELLSMLIHVISNNLNEDYPNKFHV